MRRQVGFWAVAAAMVVFSAPSWGTALQTGYTVEDAYNFGLDPRFDGSGYVTYVDGSNRFANASGNYLMGANGSSYMLVSQHQLSVAYANGADSFDVGFGNDIFTDIPAGGLVDVIDVIVDPLWDGVAGSLHDRALLELFGPPSNATAYELFTGQLSVGDHIFVGGYGILADGSFDGLFHAGENIINGTNGLGFSLPALDTFAFDSLQFGGLANETGSLPRDSGGTILVERGGDYYLAGMILAGTLDAPNFGYDSGFLPVHEMDDWIYSITGDPNAPIPEPATVTLLGMGLVSLAYTRRRQRRPGRD